MSKKLITAQLPFTMIAPMIRYDSNGVRRNLWNTFTQQHFPEVKGFDDRVLQDGKSPGLSTRMGLLTDVEASGATGAIEVTGNTFVGPTTLLIGAYALTTGDDFDVGGTATDTATSLAEAIDGLPDYSASSVGTTVNLIGPPGPQGNLTLFMVTGGSPYNFGLSPNNGKLSGAGPEIGPPTLG